MLACLCENQCDGIETPTDQNTCSQYTKIFNYTQQTMPNVKNLYDIIQLRDLKPEQSRAITKVISTINANAETRQTYAEYLNRIYTIITQHKSQIEKALKSYKEKYNDNLKSSETKLQQHQDKQTQLTNSIYTQHQNASALQQKIKLAMKVLNANGNRLQAMTKKLATYRAQNAQHDQDRVAIGLPYLKPFFTMSNRNYIIMMLVFIVVLIIIIFVYAFVGRTST